MKLVSVIIPVYNIEKYIEKCLLSVQKQTYKNLQIIIVDDGSVSYTHLMFYFLTVMIIGMIPRWLKSLQIKCSSIQ